MAGGQPNAPPVLLAFKDLAPQKNESSSAAADLNRVNCLNGVFIMGAEG